MGQANKQPAATATEVATAVDTTPDLGTKAALIMTWICAGRFGDVLKLKRKDVQLAENFAETGKIKVLFSMGKGARASQPYTVPTVCPMRWRGTLALHLGAYEPHQWFFPGGEYQYRIPANLALRAMNRAFTARALRRGALQAMATKNVPHEVLMTFSGHKRDATLLRYLAWGEAAGRQAANAHAAAVHLDC